MIRGGPVGLTVGTYLRRAGIDVLIIDVLHSSRSSSRSSRQEGIPSTRTEDLFVAGDVRVKSLRQVAKAVGDGALAGVKLGRYMLEKR